MPKSWHPIKDVFHLLRPMAIWQRCHNLPDSGYGSGHKVLYKKSRLDLSKFVFGKMGSQLKPRFRRCFCFQNSQSFQQSHFHRSRIMGPLSGLRRTRGP